jgi:pimeloyl-ACP methyl ester carboxylesterase
MRYAFVLACALLTSSVMARAQEGGGWFTGGVPTFGGLWVWTDVVIYDDWRVQQNAVTGHYRLIDPRERRHASGDLDECLAKLDAVKVEHKLKPGPKDVVIVVHGLGANRAIMSGLCEYLEDKGDLAVINFGYSSTMEDIGAYAVALDSVVRHLEGVENVSFVAHSMGNIVVRKYLKDIEPLAPGLRPQVKFQRMVMISPPNHGAELADKLTPNEVTDELADWLVGGAAKQLAPQNGWAELEPQLATPAFEFGILAGGKGDEEGYLDAIPGDDDGMLSVETMRLAGAADFVRIDSIHQFMPRNDGVRAAALSFLTNGYFVTEELRAPIAAAP